MSPDIVESMAILFAGGVKDADQGLGAVRLLWGRTLEEYFSRCDRAGLNSRPRCTLRWRCRSEPGIPVDNGMIVAR